MLGAITRVGERIGGGEEEFLRYEMLQIWIAHHLQIIGEAARALSPDLRSRHPEVRWSQVIAMRNILVHQYFGLNQRQVWMVATRDLPELRRQVERIVGPLRGGGAKDTRTDPL